MYVHHVGQALRVSALVELAGKETRKLLSVKLYPDQGEHVLEIRRRRIVRRKVRVCVSDGGAPPAGRGRVRVAGLSPGTGADPR